MIADAIKKIVDKQDLTFDEAYQVINEIMSGETTPTQNAAFLAALSTKSTKKETIEEIAGSAAAMRSHATPVPHPGMEVLEIVGTGGDRANSFNISTTASFVIAAAGVRVAKHGNRAASSKSGAADCLEALGIEINQSPALAGKLLEQIGICFCFAQKYHTSMRYVGPIRKELGIRTVFNILGPLTNPASPEYMVMGVYDDSLVEPIAKVLNTLGVKHGLVIYGRDCLDEISISDASHVCELNQGTYTSYDIQPEDFGLTRAQKMDIVGGTPEENAQITLDILSGKQGPQRDIVLLNAGAAIYAGGKAKTLAEGVKTAAKMIDTGKAMEVLEKYRVLSHEEEE